MARVPSFILASLLITTACVGTIDGSDDTADPGSQEGNGGGTPSKPGTPTKPTNPTTPTKPTNPTTPTTPTTPSGGLDCHDAASWPADWVAFEDETVKLINERRAAGATCGDETFGPAGPLKVDPHLREAARCHSLDMGTQAYFDHTSKDGRSPWKRIEQAGYTGSARAENIIAGTGTPESSVDGWMKSDGHCKNIMNADSTETGLGYAYVKGSPYGHYGTETFGTR